MTGSQGDNAVLAFVGPTGAEERDGFWVVLAFEEADAFVGEGGLKAEFGAAFPKPFGEGLGDPSVDPGNDLTGTHGRNIERTSNVELFAAADNNESVDVEVAAGGDVGCGGHVVLPIGGRFDTFV